MLRGQIPESQWNSTQDSLFLQVAIPVFKSDNLIVDVDRSCARVRAGTDSSYKTEIIVRLPRACLSKTRTGEFLYSTREMTAEIEMREAEMMRVVLRLPRIHWQEWRRLSMACFEDTESGCWSSSWSTALKLARDELPEVSLEKVKSISDASSLPLDVARIIAEKAQLAEFDDVDMRPRGWSHGICDLMLRFMHLHAWQTAKEESTKYDAVKSQICDLLSKGDFDQIIHDAHVISMYIPRIKIDFMLDQHRGDWVKIASFEVYDGLVLREIAKKFAFPILGPA